jgi:hypothetical protein
MVEEGTLGKVATDLPAAVPAAVEDSRAGKRQGLHDSRAGKLQGLIAEVGRKG